MRRVDRFDGKAAELKYIARRDYVQVALQRMFSKAILNKPDRQTRRVDRHVKRFEKIRNGADVVLVCMRNHDAAYLAAVFVQIRKIRDDQIDAEHLVVGERDAAVDD